MEDPHLSSIIIKNYKIEKIVGKGSYGDVYLGINLYNNQYVAIKKFIDVLEEPQEIVQIARQLQILRSLNHPNIIRIIDAFIYPESSKDLYIIMEYFSNDLFQFYNSDFTFKESQIKNILYSILSAIGFMHSAGIVHRDIKPTNILINHEGQVKLCDFDLAKSIHKIIKSDPIVNLSNSTTLTYANKNRKEYEIEIEFEQRPIAPKQSDNQKFNNFPFRNGDQFSLINLNMANDNKTRKKIISNNYDNNFKSIKKDEISKILQLTKKERIKKNRELSLHVCTRWYRPPEVILRENYDYSADIWGIGCIFAELLLLKKKARINSHTTNIFLKGDFCHPLSPKTNECEDNSDQLQVILNTLGKPNDEDTCFITRDENIKYIKKIATTQKKRISEIFPGITQVEADLLSKMLEFNPYFRISAQECLNHSYFDNTVDKIPFQPSKNKIKLHSEIGKEINLNFIFRIIEKELHYYKEINDCWI